MIKPDVIVCQPSHVDYPLFRYNISRFRHFFNDVFIAFTQDTLQPDLRKFITRTMRDVRFVYPPDEPDRPDWRDRAVREVLKHRSRSEWVLFLEQDFLIKDERFFEKTLRIEGHDAVLYMEGQRIHPAFALVHRRIVNKTSLDFAANPPFHDHFGRFFREVADGTTWLELQDVRLERGRDFYHMAGLTQNYYCFRKNQPLYKEKEFLTYNHHSLLLPIEQEPEFKALSQQIDLSYEEDNPDIRSFFPA